MDGLSSSAVRAITQICPGGVVLNSSLSELSYWRIGGLARIVIRPKSTIQLMRLRQFFSENDCKYIVIGATSNLLFADEGLSAPCIQIGKEMSNIDVGVDGRHLKVEAGVWVPNLSRIISSLSLTGAEHICGIPGTFGGLVCMNGGSQRKGIGENIVSVESVDRNGGRVIRNIFECHFEYRKSIFQRNDEFIASATLKYDKGDKKTIRREMLSILADRRLKFPRKHPSCGSVFKSNPSMYSEVGPPGAAIQSLGLKGMVEGGAKISDMHANFIINTGCAKAKDVLKLVHRMRNGVYLKTGYLMETEAKYVCSDGDIIDLDKIVDGASYE